MAELVSVYRSNIPVTCHAVRGRLLSEGIECYIFDENMVWLDPFSAIAIGGVRLMVPSGKAQIARKIIALLSQGLLIDKQGEYNLEDAVSESIVIEEVVLQIQHKIRTSPVDTPVQKPTILSEARFTEIIKLEGRFRELSNSKIEYSLDNFLFNLLETRGDLGKYLRPRSAAYYVQRDLVLDFANLTEANDSHHCPACSSPNIRYGHAIDIAWDFPYLALSFLFGVPFFPIRKNYHCFECDGSFKRI